MKKEYSDLMKKTSELPAEDPLNVVYTDGRESKAEYDRDHRCGGIVHQKSCF